MEQVADILRHRVERLQQQSDRDSGQAPQTGNKKKTGYNAGSCQCNSYGEVHDVIRNCHMHVSPFEIKLCNTIKDKWQALLRQSGVYERFWDANFDHIEQRGVPDVVSEQFWQVRKYTTNLKKHLSNGDGLILKGPVGTMKTTLAVAVLQEALCQGYTGRKILMQSLLDEIFSRKAYRLADWLKFEQDLRECRLLVVDELGKHQTEGWVMTKFEAIVSERHERRRSTIFVTNLTAQEMKGIYSEGIIDRFNHVNQIINFTGKSQRVAGD